MRQTIAALLAALAPTCALAQQTITFQNGLDGYAGTFDRRISLTTSVSGRDLDTSTSPYWIDGDPQDASRADVLFRFDDIVGPSAIPAGATILSATLNLRTTGEDVNENSRSGESFNVYRLTQAFDDSSTLDGDFGNGDDEFTNDVDGVEPEQGEADWILSTFDTPVGGSGLEPDMTYSADITRAVQSWVNGDTNYGVAVLSDHVDQDDGWSVHSTGSPTVEHRPSLTVTYSTNPNYRVFELQNGLNNYAGATDRVLNLVTDVAGTNDDRSDDTVEAGVDGSTLSEVYLDGDNGADSYDTPYLIRFDTSSVTGDVTKAELLITTGFSGGASDTPGPFTVHQLLTPFDAASQYGDFAGDVQAMINAGQIGPVVEEVLDVEESEYVRVDVTSIVRNWHDGDENYGFYIGANGTSNGWQIFTTGAVDSDLAPMLRITTVPEPISLALLALGGLLPLRRRG
ncbi:hypothetical protein KOR34_48320 [Posidoniimonas corsicana]|uniref:PEP-CTERM protein-sorting domain-containing protein n=1 Tax=Posidoniimonas corsicana TaxID=1938618 RepID=A0A5C5UVA1_9BACT|nr:DNRLRE domain-containing protein [Posidoniimonas corsicana]TWT30274.1 hypothetical protein KOR34_48320 [Posidoniimonas corsicana]